MNAWPDRRILDLLGVELPIILAPMAGCGTIELAIAVSQVDPPPTVSESSVYRLLKAHDLITAPPSS
jgi:NAD(P)H-dependent flavin oxidoreductase YrpB (nitropropane dioxygenase family)